MLPIVALLVGMIACVVTALTAPAPRAMPGEGDVALYRAIVERVRAGEGYYDAAGSELRGRGYGLRSPLNWRMPTLAYLAATPIAKPLLIVVAAVAVALGLRFAKEEGGIGLAAAAALVLPSVLLPTVLGDTYLMPELWAGTLILLSIMLVARRPLLSVAPAIAALFIRELAAAYVIVLFVHLVRRGDKKVGPAILVGCGLIAFAGFYLWHRSAVAGHVLPTDAAYPGSYFTLQGLPFLLATSRQAAYLLVQPLWVTAIYLPLAIFGLFQLPQAIRPVAAATALTYLVLFTVAGKPFNDYWGLLLSPVLTVSFLFALARVIPLRLRRSGLRQIPVATRRTGALPGEGSAPSRPSGPRILPGSPEGRPCSPGRSAA